jgi:hypothetical protein
MKKLTIKDFEFRELVSSFGYWYMCKLEDGRGVCLERCLNGYDVAIYDTKLDLIGKKVCTDMVEPHAIEAMFMRTISREAVDKAIEIANELLGNK